AGGAAAGGASVAAGGFASLPAADGAFVSAGAAGVCVGAVVSAPCASAGAAANSISAMIAMRAMRNNGETAVIVARKHSSARQPREACPIVMAGLDPAIHLLRKKFLRRW